MTVEFHEIAPGVRVHEYLATEHESPFDILIQTADDSVISDFRISLTPDQTEQLAKIAAIAVVNFRRQLARSTCADLFDDLNDVAAEHDADMTRPPF